MHHQRPELDQGQRRERDPEMHRTAKGQQYYFGMKARVGIDSRPNSVGCHGRSSLPIRSLMPEIWHEPESERITGLNLRRPA